MICLSIRTSLTVRLSCAVCFVQRIVLCRGAEERNACCPTRPKAYVSVADVGVLRDSFNRTQWGQLVHDPAMQPFVEDFRHQLQQKGGRQLEDLGLSWEDLEGVPGGEMSFALVQPGPGRMAVVVLVDVTGHRDQATALVGKIERDSDGPRRFADPARRRAIR